jgi:hypothetical protein
MNDRWNELEEEPPSSLDIELTPVDSRNHPRDFILGKWT